MVSSHSKNDTITDFFLGSLSYFAPFNPCKLKMKHSGLSFNFQQFFGRNVTTTSNLSAGPGSPRRRQTVNLTRGGISIQFVFPKFFNVDVPFIDKTKTGPT